MIPELVDTVLDRSLLLGYTRIGPAVRRRLGWPADPEADALRGRAALVTGANSGLGRASAAGLAELGAAVHLVVRNRTRGEDAVRSILAEQPGAELHLHVCDVADLDSVRAFADSFTDPLALLVHNAGAVLPRRTETAQGVEATFATHVLGPYLLTGLLLDRLASPPTAPPGRVIFVSSGGMYAQRLPADDLQYRHGEYKPLVAYARTKRMQVVLAELFAGRVRDRGVVVHSGHPGWADTPGVSASLPGFRTVVGPLLRTSEDGADLVTWLAAAPLPGRTTGLFWHDRRPRPTHYLGLRRETPADRDRLWRECAALASWDL